MATNVDAAQSKLQLATLKAILALIVDFREHPDHPTKPEILLHSAGLAHKDIADLLQKKEDAVRKVISRGK